MGHILAHAIVWQSILASFNKFFTITQNQQKASELLKPGMQIQQHFQVSQTSESQTVPHSRVLRIASGYMYTAALDRLRAI